MFDFSRKIVLRAWRRTRPGNGATELCRNLKISLRKESGWNNANLIVQKYPLILLRCWCEAEMRHQKWFLHLWEWPHGSRHTVHHCAWSTPKASPGARRKACTPHQYKNVEGPKHTLEYAQTAWIPSIEQPAKLQIWVHPLLLGRNVDAWQFLGLQNPKSQMDPFIAVLHNNPSTYPCDRLSNIIYMKKLPNEDVWGVGLLPHVFWRWSWSFRNESNEGTFRTWHSFRSHKMTLNWLLDRWRRGRLSTISRSKDYSCWIRYYVLRFISKRTYQSVRIRPIFTICANFYERINLLIIRLDICHFTQTMRHHIDQVVCTKVSKIIFNVGYSGVVLVSSQKIGMLSVCQQKLDLLSETLLLKSWISNQRCHICRWYNLIEWIICIFIAVMHLVTQIKECRSWGDGNSRWTSIEVRKSLSWIYRVIFGVICCCCFSALFISNNICLMLTGLQQVSLVGIADHPTGCVWTSLEAFLASNLAWCIVDLKHCRKHEDKCAIESHCTKRSELTRIESLFLSRHWVQQRMRVCVWRYSCLDSSLSYIEQSRDTCHSRRIWTNKEIYRLREISSISALCHASADVKIHSQVCISIFMEGWNQGNFCKSIICRNSMQVPFLGIKLVMWQQLRQTSFSKSLSTLTQLRVTSRFHLLIISTCHSHADPLWSFNFRASGPLLTSHSQKI